MNEHLLRILQELVPYHFGEGKPYKPGERADCKTLVKSGHLEPMGGDWYRLTAEGLAVAEGLPLVEALS